MMLQSKLWSRASRVVAAARAPAANLSNISTGSAYHPAKSLVMGCVCYDPVVSVIWDGMRDYLNGAGVKFDYVLFDTYEDQVKALCSNSQSGIDLAWNGPVAHILCEQQADNITSLGMRDVDRDFESVVIVRKDAHVNALTDLNGKRLVTGSRDSPQAHIVPMYYLQQQEQIQFQSVTPCDYDLGKHGDTAMGEIKALEALSSGTADAAVLSRMMWDRAMTGMLADTLAPDQLLESCEELTSAHLPVLDHCQFDAATDTTNKQQLNDFGEALFAMDMDNADHAVILKLEGIREKWVGPRQEGYDIVRSALGVDPNKRATNFPYQDKRSSSSMSQQHRCFSSTTKSTTKRPPRSSSSMSQQHRCFSSTTKSTTKRVCVVGAGVAGLQTVRALQAAGMNVTAFEASSSVGGVWKDGTNYSNFGLQVPKQLFEFQDYPFESVQWGDYATASQVQHYIEGYAEDFGLRPAIKFNTKVTAVEQDDKKRWKVQTESSLDGKKTEEFDYLVVATGLFSGANKVTPSISGQEKFDGEILHSSDFSDACMAQNKRVVVVGGGKSAVDCAVEAARGGASSVTMLQRTAHWPTPQKIAGLIPFQYIFLSRLGTALVSTHRGTFPGSGKAINAFRNSIVGPLLMRPVFGAVEELFAFQFGLSGDLRPKSDVVTSFYGVALVLNSDLKDMRKEGKIDVKMGEIESYSGDKSVSLKDGSSLEADLIVFATGFQNGLPMITDPTIRQKLNLQNSDGMYLYRYILPDKVENLAFVGHMSAISNISSYGLQAEWLARYLTGGLVAEPTPAIMQEEIKARQHWARSWMPDSANRGMNVLLHQTHYHDQLLTDMGLDPCRKSNILAEYIMPYEPADYNGIMGGVKVK